MTTFLIGLVMVVATAWVLLAPLFDRRAHDPVQEEIRDDGLDRSATIYQDLRDLELDYMMEKVEEKEYQRIRDALEDVAITYLKAGGDMESGDMVNQRTDLETVIERRRSRWTKIRYGASKAMAVLLVLGLPGRLHAQNQNSSAGEPLSQMTGSIVLLVSNGTEDAAVPDNLEVALEGVSQNSPDPVLIKTAFLPASGRLLFEDIVTGPGIGYRVTTVYQDAEYTSSIVIPTVQVVPDTISLTLYEATEDPGDVFVLYDHNIVTAEKGGVRILQMLIMENKGDRVYIGPLIEEIGQRAALRVELPDEATEIELQSGLMQCCVQFMEHTLVERMPVFPGTREIIFSYAVPARKGEVILPKRTYYRVVQAEIFIPEDLRVSISEPLSLGEPFEAGGKKYQRVVASDLEAGVNTVVTISGLVGPSGLGIPRFALAGLIALFFLIGMVTLSWRSKRSADDKENTAKPDAMAADFTQIVLSEEWEKDLVIERIAWLDDLFETGALDETFYRKERAMLLKLVDERAGD